MHASTIDNLVIRPALISDLEQLLELSTLVGSGMTSMPSEESVWREKLNRSIKDFNDPKPTKNGDIYFMVLEDLNLSKVVGCCAVYVGIGLSRPFYSYKLNTLTTSSEKLDLTIHTRILNLVNDYTGTTEIGSLFLLPEYRRDGIGKFLSRSRFLLMADFPDRFDETVFAEMRGWLNEKDESPFWEHLGHKFFGLSFQKADHISAVDGFQFISDLMPKYPVYLDLLPEAAQSVVGKPHADATGAFKILKKEGFQYTGYVDIFDAGPSIQTTINQINTVSASHNVVVGEIYQPDPSKIDSNSSSHIISNNKIEHYRMSRTALTKLDDKRISIPQTTATALGLSLGDSARIVQQ